MNAISRSTHLNSCFYAYELITEVFALGTHDQLTHNLIITILSLCLFADRQSELRPDANDPSNGDSSDDHHGSRELGGRQFSASGASRLPHADWGKMSCLAIAAMTSCYIAQNTMPSFTLR